MAMTEMLAAVEVLMNEFHSSHTSNNRKREIEHQLETFRAQSDAWQHCLHSLNHCSNQHVWMYAANTLENVIIKRWQSLSMAEHSQMKETLWRNYTSNADNTQRFQTYKVAKLIAIVAKRDCPHHWPEYFDNALELVKSPQCMLGVVLLRVTSEEIIHRDDVSSARRLQLQTLLNTHMDHLFTVLTQLLQAVASRSIPGQTPPCSPNDHIVNENILSEIMAHGNGYISELSFELLCTVQHLFSWVILAEHISSDLLSTLFLLSDATTQPTESLCTVALSAITELLYRKCILPGLPALLCRQIMQLLYRLNLCDTSSKKVTDSYLEKLTVLLEMFVCQYYGRMTMEPEFDALQFLSFVFQYTFSVNYHSVECYLACIDVWCLLIDHVKTSNLSSRYTDAFTQISTSCLNSVLFSTNERLLDTIDTETLDDDLHTDWQNFVDQCFELLSKIADLLPLQVLNMMADRWKSLLTVYMQIGNAINVETKQLHIDEAQVHNVHNMLRDLSTLTQGLGRLASVVTGEFDVDMSQIQMSVQTVVAKSIEACYFANKHNIYCMKCSYEPVNADLQLVQANLLLTLSSYIPWLSRSNASVQTVSHLVQCAIVPLTNTQSTTGGQVPHEITNSLHKAGAMLLLNISNILRPQELVTLEGINKLIHGTLHYETTIQVHQSIINNLILPWNNVSDQNWCTRTYRVIQYISNLSCDYLNIPTDARASSSEETNVVNIVTNCLDMHKGILDYYQESSSGVKNLLKNAYEPILEKALALINCYSLNGPISEPVMSFCLSALKALQHQLGAQFTKNAVTNFINAATREQLSSARLHAIDKLLQILQLVVLLPGSAFKCFLPDIIRLAMDHVSPIAQSSESDESYDVTLSLLSLYDTIMQHKWQYFCKSQVLLGNSPLQAEGVDELRNAPQLQAMLLAYGRGLADGDLAVFKTCLHSLERLNNKWRIYHKNFFRHNLLPHFLTTLLNDLLSNKHALMCEDVATAVFNMAAVDMGAFCNAFLPQFLAGNRELVTDVVQTFHEAQDQPTFTLNLSKLINDLRCIQQATSSSY